MAVEAMQDEGDSGRAVEPVSGVAPSAPPGIAPVIRLDLLGPFRIPAEPRLLEALGRKAQALLAYLAATPGHRASRERLASLLWGERFDEQARQSLRQTLMTLRRSLGEVAPGLLTADRNEVSLDAALFSTDIAAFEHAEGTEDLDSLRAGAALWRGAFLTDLDIPSPDYEDWLRNLRDGWRLRMVMLQLRLGRRLLDAGLQAEALRTINALIEIDPLNEEARRLELILVARISGVAAAMQCYQRFVSLLDRELGVAPEAETRALVERLGQGESPSAIAAVAALPAATTVDAIAEPVPSWRRPLGLAGLALLALLAVAGVVQFFGGIRPEQTGSSVAVARAPLYAFHISDAADGDAGAAFREELRTWVALLPASALVTSRQAASFVIDTMVKTTPGGQRAINLRLVDTAGGQTLWADSIVTEPGNETRATADIAVRLYAELLIEMQRRLGPPPETPKSHQAGWDMIVGGITRERVAEGRRFFQALVQEKPGDPHAELGLAQYISLDLANRWSKDRDADILQAIGYAENALRKLPRSTVAFLTLGVIHKSRRDYARALTAWEVQVAITPRDPTPLQQIAHVNLLLGNVREGLERAELALQLRPNPRVADRGYFYAGMGHLLAGNYTQAEQYLARAIAMNPVLPDSYAWRVAALAQAGRQEEAEALYADMMQRFPWWNVDHHLTQTIDRSVMDRFSVGMGKVIHASR